jgi:ribosomal protein L17
MKAPLAPINEITVNMSTNIFDSSLEFILNFIFEDTFHVPSLRGIDERKSGTLNEDPLVKYIDDNVCFGKGWTISEVCAYGHYTFTFKTDNTDDLAKRIENLQISFAIHEEAFATKYRLRKMNKFYEKLSIEKRDTMAIMSSKSSNREHNLAFNRNNKLKPVFTYLAKRFARTVPAYEEIITAS